MSRKLPPEVLKQHNSERFKRWSLNNRPRLRANYKRWYYRHQESYNAQQRKEYSNATERHRRQWRDSKYRNNYNITLEDYEAILVSQSGKCAICGSTQAGKVGQCFAVDHCHQTNKVRGLLCINCNGRLGWYEANSKGVQKYMRNNGRSANNAIAKSRTKRSELIPQLAFNLT